MTYDSTTTVAEIVADRPARSRFFERLGIDYCCGGKRPIGELCAERGLDAQSVLDALSAFEHAAGSSNVATDLRALTAEELSDHIVARHHTYLRRELPRLLAISTKVIEAHGDREPRLGPLNGELTALTRALERHLDREESSLFSHLAPNSRSAHSLLPVIAALEEEHREAGEALRRIRSLTDGYAAPEWACNTYRALYDGLRELEADLHEHIHEENNLLFPRILQEIR